MNMVLSMLSSFSCCNIHLILKSFVGLFFLSGFSFHEHSLFTGQQGKGEGIFFNSSLPLPPASQTLRHQAGDYCRELISAHSQQPDSNREPLVSKRKLLTAKPLALYTLEQYLKLFQTPQWDNIFAICEFKQVSHRSRREGLRPCFLLGRGLIFRKIFDINGGRYPSALYDF